MSATIWFEHLHDGYVQVGSYRVVENYLPGHTWAPHVYNDTGLTGNDLTNALQPFPETFSREWYTFRRTIPADGNDYDYGAYGVGARVHSRTINVPIVKLVGIMYMYWLNSTKEVRTLVQIDGGQINAIALGLLDQNGNRIMWREEDYYREFAPEGFNQFGSVLPELVARSNVNELASFLGDFELADGNTVNNVRLFVNPLYIRQARPMFDMVYVQGGVRGQLDPNAALISGHLLRWRGQYTSEHRAPINYDGDAIEISGANPELYSPMRETGLVENGISYTGADMYNVNDMKRF